MAETIIYTVRLVIQRCAMSSESNYRLIVYGRSSVYGHSDFRCKETLLDAIQRAIPGFDISVLLLKIPESSEASIIFGELMNLDILQLSILGFDKLSHSV
jgi:hypothetical protein